MATAVEWLHKESNELIIKFLDNEIDMIIFIELYHNNYCKAKEMEKEQIEDAYSNGRVDEQFKGTGASFYITKAEQYYNETFKNK